MTRVCSVVITPIHCVSVVAQPPQVVGEAGDFEPSTARNEPAGALAADALGLALHISPTPGPRFGVRTDIAWPRNAFGFVLASILLHVAAIVVFAHDTWFGDARWIVPLSRGSNSIELSASVAAPPPEHQKIITVEPPDILAPEIQAMEQPLVKRNQAKPERPTATFAVLREDDRLPPTTVSETRAAIEVPEASEEREAPIVRKPRAVPQAVPREVATKSLMESVASNPSAASSGVVADEPPKPIRQIQPLYPAESLAAREAGVVKLLVKVDATGNVETATLHRSSGFPRLDRAALDVILSWKFEPADGRKTGRAAEFIWSFTFRDRNQAKPR
ncbi:MAG: TonB family protein [Planctomycetia bacterium]|nr:TonB family protein [Planctomycetia bacterium]